MAITTRAWLYIRSGMDSVRIEMEEGSITISGPGERYRRRELADITAAMLEHSALERELVRQGWSLERMTTERRSGEDRRAGLRGPERRRAFRVIPSD